MRKRINNFNLFLLESESNGSIKEHEKSIVNAMLKAQELHFNDIEGLSEILSSQDKSIFRRDELEFSEIILENCIITIENPELLSGIDTGKKSEYLNEVRKNPGLLKELLKYPGVSELWEPILEAIGKIISESPEYKKDNIIGTLKTPNYTMDSTLKRNGKYSWEMNINPRNIPRFK